MKKILLALSYLMAVATPPLEANTFEIYADGIYDAYVQINKDIQEGVEEKWLREYENKFLVVLPVENASTVKIIFYKTVGSKNALSPIVAKNQYTKESVLVFGYFDRVADAKGLQEKLLLYGLEDISVIENRDTYKRNPIVIKKLIGDLNRAIKDTTVRVVKIEKEVKHYTPLPMGNTHKKQKSKKAPSQVKNNADDFLSLRKNYCKNGFMRRNHLFLGSKKYAKGDKLGKFRIVSFLENSTILRIMGEDLKTYHIKNAWCEKSSTAKNKKQEMAKEAPTPSLTKEEEITTAVVTEDSQKSSATQYLCDFKPTDIVIREGFPKATKIANTAYSSDSTIKVSSYGEKGIRIKVKAPSLKYIYLSKRLLKKRCRQR